jgi:hypothetical protein
LVSDLGLAEAIEAVRDELRRTQEAGAAGDVRFSVGSVEIEFVVDVATSGGGEASIKVLSLVSLGGKGEVSRGETNRVKVTLTPVTASGEPYVVSDEDDERPDGGSVGS